jgi:calcineurin-like phosphoesterase family protein
MANIFFASDHHLGHENMLKFKRNDDSPLRDFSHVDHMNEYIIERHNARVRPGDKTYFLGDVVMSHKWLYLLDRMNGEKVLIKGNHDTAKLSQYTPYFKDIRGSHQFSGIIMTHIPIHSECLARWGVNIHGHLHYHKIMDQYGRPDKRYYNVSMECLKDYTPISLEEIKSELDLMA